MSKQYWFLRQYIDTLTIKTSVQDSGAICFVHHLLAAMNGNEYTETC